MGGGNLLILDFVQPTHDAALLMVVLNAKLEAAVSMPGLTMQNRVGVGSPAHSEDTPSLAPASCRVALVCNARVYFGREIHSHASHSLRNACFLTLNIRRKMAECM